MNENEKIPQGRSEQKQERISRKEELLRQKSLRINAKGESIAAKFEPRLSEDNQGQSSPPASNADAPEASTALASGESVERSGESVSEETLTDYKTQNSAENEPSDKESSSADGDGSAPLSNSEISQEKKKNTRYLLSGIVLSTISIVVMIAICSCVIIGLFANTKGTAVIPVVYTANSGAIYDFVDSMLEKIGIDLPDNEFSGKDGAQAVASVIDSVVLITVDGSGSGSGVIISSDGYIVTNYHVVEGAADIYVKLYKSSQNLKAELIGYSKHDDIAVLKIDQDRLSPATLLSDCSSCKEGETVYAIGAPEGSDYAWSVTRGIVSAVNREIKIYNGSQVKKKMRLIQTDATINRGNSGGALINSQGQVIGIVTMRLDSYIKGNGTLYNIDGMGFALPSDGVIPLVRAIIENGNTDGVTSTISSGRPMLGITCVTVEKDLWYVETETGISFVEEEYAMANPGYAALAEESGILVTSTTEGMDAHGKILHGDIITNADGIRVYTVEQLTSYLNDLHGGDTVNLKVFRNGESVSIGITLKEAPIE